jgi:tRNA threonylcarbamoyladenosine biosynthesis protein TsaE
VRVESAAPEDTEAVAAALAAELEPGDVVTIAGELGAGKTTFVRGACRALGVTDPVTSPTFTIGHRYAAGDRVIAHLDLYRFQGFSAAEWGDLEPYFDGTIAFVEWPEAGEGALPEPRVRVRLEHADEMTRRIVHVDGSDEALVERVNAALGLRHGDA